MLYYILGVLTGIVFAFFSVLIQFLFKNDIQNKLESIKNQGKKASIVDPVDPIDKIIPRKHEDNPYQE